MPKPELEFTPTDSFPEELSPGLSKRVLSADPETRDHTVLLIHAPGSAWGEPVCTHDYWEEVYIIDGRIYDKTLQKWFGAGDYCCRPPSILHGPFEADEELGCKEICWLRYPRNHESVAIGGPP